MGKIKLEDDNKTLKCLSKDNLLKKNDVFIVKFEKDKNMELIIKDDTDIIEVSINSMDTVEKLYDLINDKIGKNINLEHPDNSYILKYGNRYLNCLKSMIFEFNFFQNNKNISFLRLEKIHNFIFVEFMWLNVYDKNIIVCEPKEKIKDIKSKIIESFGCNINYLIYYGKQLDLSRNLEDYNINKGSTIDIFIKQGDRYCYN